MNKQLKEIMSTKVSRSSEDYFCFLGLPWSILGNLSCAVNNLLPTIAAYKVTILLLLASLFSQVSTPPASLIYEPIRNRCVKWHL